jgi:molecular chaperone DnaK
MNVLGIDAGTTRFKTAILNTSGEPQSLTNRAGEIFTPSVVSFAGDGSVLVGAEAANAALADPTRAVFDWKMNMGTDKVLCSVDGTGYRAVDILAILLKTVKEDAEAKTGEPVNEAVITVPANYSNVQKQQTHEAANEAGLKVIITPHEPTAGALGNKVYKLKKGIVAVYDLGGGTFDVSIIEIKGNVSSVIATGGIQQLGGRDFNKCIEAKIIEEFEKQHQYRPDSQEDAIFYQDLHNRVEQVKISLSAQTQCNVVLSCNGDLLNMTVTRQQFEDWAGSLVTQSIEQTEATLKEAGLEWTDIDAIYPIGGGSMMPIVIRSLEEASGKKVTQNCEAHCAAALGAAIAGRLEYDRQRKAYRVGSATLPPTNFDIKDILSRAVGVLALDENNHQICCEILAKDTPIPSIQTRNFKLSELGQTDVQIQILQGREGDKTDDCEALGHFDLKDLPSRSDVINRIEVSFDLDKNGLLTASARDTVSNKKAELEIDYNNPKES